MSELKIKYLKTADLIPYVNNSREHSEEQVTQVASSIQTFGFTNPILVDEKKSIIAGHGRLLAAKKLELDKVPTITLTGLTDAEKKAYVIADNKLALNSSWNFEMLKLEMESLIELDFDLSLMGFDSGETDEILNGWGSDLDDYLGKEPEDENDGTDVIKIKCLELDKDDLINLLDRAIAQSGLQDVKFI